MNNLPLSKDILIRALLTVEEAENVAIEKTVETPIEYPKSLDEKLVKLYDDFRNNKLRKRDSGSVIVKPKRKIIAYILIAAVLLSILCLSVTAIREPVFNFFINIYEAFTSFSSSVDDINPNLSIEDVYTFEYMPDGYKISKIDIKPHRVETIWEYSGDNIILIQKLLTDNDSFYMDTENSAFSTLQIKDSTVFYSQKNGIYMILWNSNQYAFTMRCSSSLELEEIIKIIDSIVLDE